jgi:hypothetical protein
VNSMEDNQHEHQKNLAPARISACGTQRRQQKQTGLSAVSTRAGKDREKEAELRLLKQSETSVAKSRCLTDAMDLGHKHLRSFVVGCCCCCCCFNPCPSTSRLLPLLTCTINRTMLDSCRRPTLSGIHRIGSVRTIVLQHGSDFQSGSCNLCLPEWEQRSCSCEGVMTVRNTSFFSLPKITKT